MNSYVGAAAQGGKEKKVDLRLPEQLLRVFFFSFCGQKKYFLNIVVSTLKSYIALRWETIKTFFKSISFRVK